MLSQPLYFRKRVSRTPGTGGWVGPRGGLEAGVNSPASAGNQTTIPQLTRPKPSQHSALQTLANRQTTRCRLHTDRNLQAMPDRDSHSTARPPVPVLHRHIRYDRPNRQTVHTPVSTVWAAIKVCHCQRPHSFNNWTTQFLQSHSYNGITLRKVLFTNITRRNGKFIESACYQAVPARPFRRQTMGKVMRYEVQKIEGWKLGVIFNPMNQVSRLSSYRAVNTARLQTVLSAPCLRVLQPADFPEPHNCSIALRAHCSDRLAPKSFRTCDKHRN